MEIDVNFNLDFTMNTVVIVTRLLAWIVIIYLAYRVYSKQTEKPKIWKMALVLCAGLISLSLDWKILNEIVKIPILPLGVWFLYFVLKRKQERWQAYRRFAWLGFWANFIFLAAALIEIPIHQGLYPKNNPVTYISNVEKSAVILTHPSAKEQSINTENLLNQVHLMEPETIESEQWYGEIAMGNEPNQTNERFPYLLIGVTSKWGSGLDSMIFIEDDGKGVLITTPQQQLYFRADESLLGKAE